MGLISNLILGMSRDRIEDVSVTLPTSVARRGAKIVVVDDEESSFPVRQLQDDGYTIEWWPQVDANKLGRLERGDFDIIILDIQGIVEPGLSDTGDGLGLLRRIKGVHPEQVVVAFSGKAYDLSAVSFFRQTEDVLRKPVTLLECKETLDRLLAEKVTVRAYWETLETKLIAGGVSPRRIRNLERAISRAAKRGRQLSMDEVRGIVGSIDALATVVGWATKIIRLCTVGV